MIMKVTALRALLAAAAGVALLTPSQAQISQPGEPASTWADLTGEVPTELLSEVDVEALKAEDLDTGPFPLRYAATIDTDLGLSDSGLWEQVEADGSLVWRLRISSPGAYSLGVTFTEYEIPVGGQVFLYDDDMRDVLGAFTEFNNNVNGGLGVAPIAGDAITIEYVQQSWVTDAPKLTVGEVFHDYKDLYNVLQTGGDSAGVSDGGCGLIGINCPQGAPYQDVKRAVMRTLAGGGLCSASLLNNTSNDGTPYMYTANHCGNMSFGVFLWNYEQVSCGTSFGSTSNTQSGANQLSTSSTVDSQLYRLNITPPAAYDVYWAGWSRQTSSPSPAVTIGHGNGGPKNMAIDNSGASLSGNDWQVFWHDGYIVGGNSGGPLFNGDNRVIGPACCVNTFTCGSQTAWFGRFDRFWSLGGLSGWLDPSGTGQTTLDGIDDPGGGPGGGGLSITGVSPSTISALNVGTAQIVTITGTGFTPTTAIKINGVALGGIPSPFTYVNSTTMTFDPPDPAPLGLAVLSVEQGVDTDSTFMTFIANSTPAVQAGNGDEPVTYFSFTGLDIKVAGGTGNTIFVLASTLNTPTSAPGLFSLDIGGNFASLFHIATLTVEADGVTDLNIPVALPPLTTVYWQGLEFNGVSFPLNESNTQETQILF